MGWFENFFGSVPSRELDPDYSATIEKIETSLAGLPAERARFLACVALLAARVAHIDHQICEGEEARIRKVLRDHFELGEELARSVAAIALESERSITVEHHLVTRKLNELASREEKIAVLRALFYIAAEGDITEQESDQIGSLAGALLLPRSDFLAVRADYREHRALVKSLPKK